MEALAPFRAPFAHPAGDPAPLPYLDSAANRAQGALDIDLEATPEIGGGGRTRTRKAGLDHQHVTGLVHEHTTAPAAPLELPEPPGGSFATALQDLGTSLEAALLQADGHEHHVGRLGVHLVRHVLLEGANDDRGVNLVGRHLQAPCG